MQPLTPSYRPAAAQAGSPQANLPPPLRAGVNPEPLAPPPRISRNAAIVLGVVGLHVVFIWALQSGLLMRAAEIIVPAELLAEFITPPAPLAPPTPPKPVPVVTPTPPTPQKRAQPKAPSTPQLQPLAINDPTPSATAPTGVISQAPQAVAAAPAAAAPSPAPATPGPAKIELPSLDARYSDQDATVYPAMSRRLGEEGTTVYSVLIGTDGKAISARLVKSSGFERLDKAAYDTVMRRRYTPGTRDGVPVALSYNAPITWVLK
ncbi:MAG: energy transducer TonB [Polaromonas sp.]